MFERLLARIAAALQAAGIPYMVIGGQAVLLYGEPRFTKDVDVTLGMGPEAIDGLLIVCEQLGLRSLAERPGEFAARTMVLPCEETNTRTRVDFVLSNSGYEQRAIERAKIFLIEGQSVHVVSLQDLIVHKVVAGRPRDLEDVRSLFARNQDIDVKGIEETLAEFSRGLDEDFLARLHDSIRG